MRPSTILRPRSRLAKAGPADGLRARWQHRRQALLDHFGLVAGVLLLSCAMPWAVAEHSRQKAELHLAETNRHIVAFQSPPIGDAWRRLSGVWHDQQARQNALLGRIGQLSGALLQEALGNYRAFVIDTVDEQGLAPDIDKVVRFYRRLASCIRIGSCDPAVAAGRFGSAARSFRNQHYYYLQDAYRVDEIDRVIDVIAPRRDALT